MAAMTRKDSGGPLLPRAFWDERGLWTEVVRTGSLTLVDTTEWIPLETVPFERTLDSAQWTSRGESLITLNGRLRLRSRVPGGEQTVLLPGRWGCINPDGSRIVAIVDAADGSHDLRTFVRDRQWGPTPQTEKLGKVDFALIAPPRRMYAGRRHDGEVIAIDADAGAILRRRTFPGLVMRGMHLNPDGRWLFIADAARTLLIVSARDLGEGGRVELTAAADAIAVSADGVYLAASGAKAIEIFKRQDE